MVGTGANIRLAIAAHKKFLAGPVADEDKWVTVGGGFDAEGDGSIPSGGGFVRFATILARFMSQMRPPTAGLPLYRYTIPTVIYF